MTDDPHGPVGASEEPQRPGNTPRTGASLPGSSRDRRNVVNLVPPIPGPVDPEGVDPDGVEHALPGAVHLAPDGVDVDGQTSGAVGAARVATAVVEPEEDPQEESPEPQDWAWVQEWRAGHESTPWATGLALTAFSALIVGVAVWVLSAGLADRPVIAVLVNLLVAAGLAPAIWLSRGLPVLRWIAGGAAAGIVIGWASAILMLPYPSS